MTALLGKRPIVDGILTKRLAQFSDVVFFLWLNLAITGSNGAMLRITLMFVYGTRTSHFFFGGSLS